MGGIRILTMAGTNSRRYTDRDGVDHFRDVTWEELRGTRTAYLSQTDLWYLSDRWAILSSVAKGQLNAWRQTMRDLPQDYDNANDAWDNMPEPQDWFGVVL